MKVLVPCAIPDTGLVKLRNQDIEVVVLGRKRVSKDHLVRALKKDAYDGLITLVDDSVDADVIAAAGSNMKVIANYAVGYNNIDLSAAKERNIVITNTPGVLTNTVAEHAFGLILAVATRVVEADDYVRAKKFTGWEPELLLGLDLQGKTLGIIGAGRIGARVASFGTCFGMQVVYHDIQRNEVLEKQTGGVFAASPEELLRQVDVVSVHLPLTETTHHFLEARRLSLLKKTAILVNTSRGSVIDEEALIALLREGKIFGAGLDVFEYEPKVPRALRRLPNVILTPHIASSSVSTRTKMSEMVAENILMVLHGGDPPNRVS